MFYKTLFVLASFLLQQTFYVDAQSNCVDAFYCAQFAHLCSSNNFIRDNCPQSCNPLCSSRTNSPCRALNCQKQCEERNNGRNVRCTCRRGYKLNRNGRSCDDVNECLRTPNICGNSGNRICVNNVGSYSCGSCRTQTGLSNYYGRSQCCKRNPSVTCGKAPLNFGRIVGGSNADEGSWPWQGLIRSYYLKIFCGGSLITPRWVISAAHCCERARNSNDYKRIEAIFGVVDFQDSTNIHRQRFLVENIRIHPNYGGSAQQFRADIALVRLNRDARIGGEYVRTICLPNGESPSVGDTCYATGFGTLEENSPRPSRLLQEVDLPVVSYATCRRGLSSLRNDSHFCAGYERGGKDSCQGDSGGPLVCQRRNNCDWYLAGITSYGRGCARAGLYGAYTRVIQYEQWFKNTINSPCQQGSCSGSNTGSWQQWGRWSACDAPCNGGLRRRTRGCRGGAVGSSGCSPRKNNQQNRPCNTRSCNVKGNVRFRPWGSWQPCTVSCAGGYQQRNRTCRSGRCKGVWLRQRRGCNLQLC